jgi:putative transposase
MLWIRRRPLATLRSELKTFATLSDGGKCETQAYYRQAEKKLAQLQRSLCRKKLGSKNRMKANKRVAKLHDRVTNLRQNMLHEFTTRVVEGHGIICIEDLNLKGLVQTRLAKSFSDVAIGETIRQLQSKAEAARRIIQRVGRFYPSSQLCSVCGYRNRELGLADRDWTCPSCDSRLDRDLNAAINIELEGLRLLAASGYVGVTPVDRNPLLHNLGDEARCLDETGTKVCAYISSLFR